MLRVIARNRAVTLALLSAIASALMGFAVTIAATPADSNETRGDPFLPLLGFAIAVLLIVLAGTVPSEYEVANRVDFMLPVIHRVLGLKDDERVTVHRLVNFPVRQFEQLTDYYPPTRAKTRGRRFPLHQGIISSAFANANPHAWGIPPGQSFEEAMIERWSFTAEQVKRLTQDRRSFLAYPIGLEGQYARAVLFMDSPDEARFAGDNGKKLIDLIRDYFDAQLQNAFKG